MGRKTRILNPSDVSATITTNPNIRAAVCEKHDIHPITEATSKSGDRSHLFRLCRCKKCGEEALEYHWKPI